MEKLGKPATGNISFEKSIKFSDLSDRRINYYHKADRRYMVFVNGEKAPRKILEYRCKTGWSGRGFSTEKGFLQIYPEKNGPNYMFFSEGQMSTSGFNNIMDDLYPSKNFSWHMSETHCLECIALSLGYAKEDIYIQAMEIK